MTRATLILLLLAAGLGGCTLPGLNEPVVKFDVLWLFSLTLIVIGLAVSMPQKGWIVVVVGLLMALAACAPSAHATERVDLVLLRDTICAHETRGSDDPDMELGDNGEIGRCQIRLSTARQYGFRGNWIIFLDSGMNRQWALIVLRRVAHRSCFATAFAYNAGPRARIDKDHESWAYAAAVCEKYTLAQYKRAKQLTAGN